MQTARGGVTPTMSAGWNETNRAILSELVSVILQIRRSLAVIECDIAREVEPEDESVGDVVVLDDVTPVYARSCAILRECDARLSTAVRLMLESMTPGEHTCDFAALGSSSSARASI